MSEDAALKHLARYLETQRLQQRLHQSHLPTFLSPMHKKHNVDRQEERFLKLLAERKVTLDLKQFVIKNLLAHNYRSNHNPIADQITDREPEYLLSSSYYLDLKRPTYPEEKQLNENDERFPKNIRYEQIFDVDRDSTEPILNSFGRKYIDFNHGIETLHHEGGREASMRSGAASAVTEPEFTYKFDDSNLKEKHPFAVKPNDPRYYDEAPFSSGKHSYLIH